MALDLQINDLDRRIWEEELEDFVPTQIFDIHTHIYRWAFHTAPDKEEGPYAAMVGDNYREATYDLLDAVDAQLMPGQAVHRLSFPFPFGNGCDFEASNRFIASELRGHEPSAALMLVHPAMSGEEIEAAVREHGFLGLKPYRVFSTTGDAVHCRITDFLPEHQIEVAHRHGLLIMLHLSKPDGISDPVNLDDLEYLTGKYPNAKWDLAHCARSYSAWPIERAGDRLRDMPNTWFDPSSVCESDAIEALIECVGIERVVYGSDDVPVGVHRGKYVAFGHAWAYLSETNHNLNLTHCDGRMTFTRYEQLRAMKRAANRHGLGRPEIEKLFHDNASQLVNGVRSGSPSGPRG